MVDKDTHRTALFKVQLSTSFLQSLQLSYLSLVRG